MRLYELVNPSDAYTLRAESRAVACAAALVLGAGAYALEDLSSPYAADQGMPLFLLGGGQEWFLERFGVAFASFLATRGEEIAACLDTVVIGKVPDRLLYDEAMALITEADSREKWAAVWHERKRTSLNDIGARARKLSARLRAVQRSTA